MKPATPLPWSWWTSNSHYRLSSIATGKDGDVIHAYRASDGLPVVNVNQRDAGYIVQACNAYPRLVEELANMVALAEAHPEVQEYRGGYRPFATRDASKLLRDLGELE